MANDYVKAKTKNRAPSKFKLGLGYFFRGLFSNKAAIEGANNNPWWIAIIFILFSTVLPVIPITVNASNISGSSYLGSSLNGFETKITYVTEDIKNNNKEFIVDEGKILHYYDYNDPNHPQKDIILKDTIGEYLISQYVGASNHQIELQLFYSSDIKADLKTLKTKLNGDANTYILGGTTLKGENDPEGTSYYIPSFVLLNENEMVIYLYKENSTSLSAYTSFASDWKSFKVGDKLIQGALDVDLTEVKEGTLPYFQAVCKNWKAYVNKSYLSAKKNNVLYSSLIYLGVYFVLLFFMSLMVFLLTRGKKNPFSYMKLIDCIKIMGWASICPALLSLILGFLLASYAVMIFIVLIGMRTMWLSMKQFRPY